MAEETSFWPQGHFTRESERGVDIKKNPASLMPKLPRIEPQTRDYLLSALMGLRSGLTESREAARLGDPLTAALAGISGAAAAPGAQALAQARQQQESQARLAALEALPVEQVSPSIVEKHPELAGVPLGLIHKIAPILERQALLEQRAAMADFLEAGRNERAQRERESRKEVAGIKKEEKDLGLVVPGYELSGEIRPTSKEAQDLRSGVAAVGDFVSGTDRLIALIKKHGSTNLVGEASGEMQTLAANLKLTLKEVQKLGVLSASDIAFLDAQIFDPTSLKSFGTRTATALRQLETIKDRARSGVEAGLKARGYVKAASVTPQTETPDSIKALFKAGKITREEAKARIKALGGTGAR